MQNGVFTTQDVQRARQAHLDTLRLQISNNNKIKRARDLYNESLLTGIPVPVPVQDVRDIADKMQDLAQFRGEVTQLLHRIMRPADAFQTGAKLDETELQFVYRQIGRIETDIKPYWNGGIPSLAFLYYLRNCMNEYGKISWKPDNDVTDSTIPIATTTDISLPSDYGSMSLQEKEDYENSKPTATAQPLLITKHDYAVAIAEMEGRENDNKYVTKLTRKTKKELQKMYDDLTSNMQTPKKESLPQEPMKTPIPDAPKKAPKKPEDIKLPPLPDNDAEDFFDFNDFEGTGLKLGRSKRFKAKHGKDLQKPATYVPFGRYVIHRNQLDNGTQMIKYPSGATIGHGIMKTQPISTAQSNIFKKVIKGEGISIDDIEGLSQGERNHVSQVLTKCHISHNVTKTKESRNQDDKDYRQLQICIGEYGAGNDSPELLKELKQLVVRLVKSKRITKQKGDAIIYELSENGY